MTLEDFESNSDYLGYNASFKEKLHDGVLSRTVSDAVMSSFTTDPVAAGLYAATRVKNDDDIYIFLINRRGKIVGELVIFEKDIYNINVTIKKILEECELKKCRKVAAATSKGINSEVPFRIASCIFLKNKLSEHNIAMCSYFLVNGFNFEKF